MRMSAKVGTRGLSLDWDYDPEAFFTALLEREVPNRLEAERLLVKVEPGVSIVSVFGVPFELIRTEGNTTSIETGSANFEGG